MRPGKNKKKHKLMKLLMQDILGPASLDRCRWGNRQLAGVRLEPVN